MKVSQYWLKPEPWKKNGKPYKSTFKMSAEEAAKHGLTDADIVPGTTEERQEVKMPSAGMGGVR